MTVYVTILPTGAPGLFGASINGNMIVQRSPDPEHAAARVLLALGYRGPFVTVGAEGTCRMRFASIEEAARKTVTDGDQSGLRVRRWKAFSACAGVPQGAFKTTGRPGEPGAGQEPSLAASRSRAGG